VLPGKIVHLTKNIKLHAIANDNFFKNGAHLIWIAWYVI